MKKEFNQNQTFLGVILKYNGKVKKDNEIKKEWIFVTYVVAILSEDKRYFNAINPEIEFGNIKMEEANIGDEVFQIIDFAANILHMPGSKFSSKQIYSAMEESGLYFEECEEKLDKSKQKRKKL